MTSIPRDSIGRDRTRNNAARRRIKAGEGFVYLAAFDGVDMIKIGFSLNPERRAATLGYPWPARLIATAPGGMRAEKAIHRALLKSEHRLRYGECYRRAVLSHPALPAEFRAEPFSSGQILAIEQTTGMVVGLQGRT